MPTVQIRDVPESTHRELRARAAAAGMSLSSYLLVELKRIADRPRVADALRLLEPHEIDVATEDIVNAVRADPDR